MYDAQMPAHHVDSLINKGVLAGIRTRALWLSKLNQCLHRQLPLSIDTMVRLADIDTRRRAVIHVRGGEWATHIRMQQGMILDILRTCGLTELSGIVVKNRPLRERQESAHLRKNRHTMSCSARELIEASANGISDEQLAQSLHRLARRR